MFCSGFANLEQNTEPGPWTPEPILFRPPAESPREHLDPVERAGARDIQRPLIRPAERKVLAVRRWTPHRDGANVVAVRAQDFHSATRRDIQPAIVVDHQDLARRRRAIKKPPQCRLAVAGRCWVGSIARGLLATCFAWLQAGRPNHHVVRYGDYRDPRLGVNGCLMGLQIGPTIWASPPLFVGIPRLPYTRLEVLCESHTPSRAEVAERQTHQLEGLAGATPWRFESSLPHQ